MARVARQALQSQGPEQKPLVRVQPKPLSLAKRLTRPVATEAASHAAEGLSLIEDLHGSKAYRSQMTTVMAKRAILKAVERA